MWTVFVGLVCLFIGWNIPQPQFAKDAQAAIVAWAKEQWDKWIK